MIIPKIVTQGAPVRNSSPPLGEVQAIPLTRMAAHWQNRDQSLVWQCPFVLPPWLAAWWPHFSGDYTSMILSADHRGKLAGIAPLMRKDSQARLIGNEDVCDHLDLVVAPQHAEAFCHGLLAHLAQDNLRQVVLSPVREDSTVITHLLPAARARGIRVQVDRQEQLFAMPLPTSWDTYLKSLSGKERHEIRRKFRRLYGSGQVAVRCITDAEAVPAAMDIFLTLFRANRTDKAMFMTESMQAFFRALAANLAEADLLKLYILDLDDRPIAATFCIDHHGTVYLYNNGYDDAFRSLSVGILSKVLTIRAGIDDGRQTYDFLKGAEPYKKRLGGRSVNVFHCRLEWD